MQKWQASQKSRPLSITSRKFSKCNTHFGKKRVSLTFSTTTMTSNFLKIVTMKLYWNMIILMKNKPTSNKHGSERKKRSPRLILKTLYYASSLRKKKNSGDESLKRRNSQDQHSLWDKPTLIKMILMTTQLQKIVVAWCQEKERRPEKLWKTHSLSTLLIAVLS